MASNDSTSFRQQRKRAVIAVQVGVTLVVLIGMAALTVDVGQLYAARTELQRAADAAALAGASAYTTDLMMTVRQDTGGSGALGYVQGIANSRADEFSNLNITLGFPTGIDAGDIKTGWLNLNSASENIHENPAAKDYNAVYVMTRRAAGEDGGNGPIPLFFAPIFGDLVAEASASAVAVFDDRVAGFNSGAPNAGDLTPFTISVEAFESELTGGGDSYGYDVATSTVYNSGDGIREIRLYPYPLSGSSYSEGDGNFGVLNIGTGNQGVSAEQVQILNGVSTSDLETEIGTSDLTFYDSTGSPVTYNITGSPGLEATLRSTIEQRIGDVVGFFLHDGVILSGANATYTSVDLRFGRIMDIRLTGPPNQRGFFIQPVSYSGAGVVIDPGAPSTGGLVGMLVLAR